MELVSIIVPCYKCISFIEECIKSVIQQTYTNWELIIIQDGPCKGDLKRVISKFKDSRITLINLQVNQGAAKARNQGIAAARGRFIAFLDSDDAWCDNKLENQIKFMVSKNVKLTYCAYTKIDELGNEIGLIIPPIKVTYTKLLETNYIGCSTLIYDSSFFGKVFMPINTKREDYATWLNLLKKIKYAYRVDSSMSKYRIHQNQSSLNKFHMAKENWKLYRHHEGLNFLKASYFFINYAVRGIIRSWNWNLMKY